MTITRKRVLCKRISSVTMTALIVLEQLTYLPQITASAEKSAESKADIDFPAVYAEDEVSAILTHNDQLIDNGDGTYTFTSELTSKYSYHDQSKGRLRSQDGSYTLDKAGTYLIELWGGDGGDGSSFFPLSFKAGAGGKGGFVYGLLEVSEEQAAEKNKLYYEIGSKGLSETRSVTGGGTGGIGGGAGDIAVFSVGAGGGYSAVYLLDKDENINDTVRNDPTKVLMIAGGGGGGGAGAALHTLPGLFGGEGKANGGDGGSFDSDIIDTPNIKNFVSSNSAVGKYYAGEDGSTSGTKGAYVGKGGTDIPGEIVSSFIGFLEASSYPNDWQKTYHSELARGVGGASNFRGGGGGAGFAGGSGGMQNEPLDARNVGGGGGGSSYIGNITGFTPAEKGTSGYFVEREDNTNAETGGAVVIRYLSNEGTDYDYLDNIEVSGEISEYFDIVSQNCTNNKYENGRMGKSPATYTPNGNSFTVLGSVAPIDSGLSQGQERDKLTISITIKPKDGFFGGNNVPVFKENPVTFSVASENGTKTKTSTITLHDDVKHVNVPYNIDIQTKNSTIGSGASITANKLYASGYSEIAYNLDDPMQAFISGISYDIIDPANNTSEPVSDFSYTFTDDDVDTTKTFTVRATLTPKNTAAAVGDAGSNQITKNAYVKCIDNSLLIIDDFEVAAEKTLTYDSDNDTYDLKIDTEYEAEDSDTFYVYDPISTETTTNNINTARQSVNNSNTMAYVPATIDLVPGIYYLEAYGADGGKGGDRTYPMSSTVHYRGQPGGSGGYVSGYYVVNSTTTVEMRSGYAGYNGGTGSASGIRYYCGGGGGYSGIFINNEPILVAGGGGGGGAPWGDNGNKNATAPGKDAGFNTIISTDETDYINDDGVRDNTNHNPTNIYFGENGYFESGGLIGGVGIDANERFGRGGQNLKSDDIIDEPNLPENVIPLDVSSSTGLTKATLDSIRKTPAQDEGSSNIKAGAVRITKLGVKGGYYHGTNDSSVTLATSADVATIESQLKANVEAAMNTKAGSFTLTETYDTDYFDIISADDGTINGNTVTFTDAVSIENNGTDGNAYQTDTAFAPVDGLNYTTTKRTYTYSISEGETSHTVKLRPKDGFLGGNDVQLLTSAVLEHHNNNDDPSDDSVAIPPLDYTDYANVRLASETLDDVISTDPIYVDLGTRLAQNLFSANTANYPPGVNSWQKAYADYQALTYEPAMGTSITEDTDCFITATLKANDAASKASVIDSVDAASRNFKVPVKVRYPVDTSGLVHTTQTLTSGTDTLPSVNDVTYFPTKDDDNVLLITVTADNGYDLPLMTADEIPADAEGHPERVINITGLKDGASADMEKKDGVLYISIPRDIIAGPVTITGEAYRKPHYVIYMYQRYDRSTKQISMVQTEKTNDYAYYNGDTISENYPFTPVEGECPKGYDTNNYWDWTIEKTNGQYVMGQDDVYVIGTYKPITYKLKINYYTKESDEDTQPVLHSTYISPDRSNYDEDTDTYDIALTKDAEFYVASPNISGYVTDKPFITGKVDDYFISTLTEDITDGGRTYKGKTVNVNYTRTDANVLVYFIGCDIRGVPNGETRSTITREEAVGDSYDLDGEIDTALGNSNEKIRMTKLVTNGNETVEETVDHVSGNASSDETATYYVYYRAKPETVTVEFYKERSDTTATASKQCEIGREYGYNAQTQTYDLLPRAVKNDCRLVGWEDENGKLVEDDTIVTGEANSTIKLYARWESIYVTVNVDYVYAKNTAGGLGGTQAAEPYHQENIPYGKSYNIPSPEITNYTANPIVIKGVALGNVNETVYYTDGSSQAKTITVDIYSETYQNGTVPESNAPKLKGGTFALYDSNDDLIGTKENTNGTVSWNSLEVVLDENEIYTVKCIDPPTGYAMGSITAETGVENYLFLGKTPFRLPYAGSTPLTGYTVFGSSTMLLAVFLLFVDIRSKTEDNKKNNRRV